MAKISPQPEISGAVMITTASGAISPEFKSNRLLQALTLAYGLIWVVTAINPTNRFDWFSENLLVFLLWALLAATYGRLPLSNLSYLLIALFLGFHAVGAHYTYSEMPLGAWLKDAWGEDRNHYDRANRTSRLIPRPDVRARPSDLATAESTIQPVLLHLVIDRH